MCSEMTLEMDVEQRKKYGARLQAGENRLAVRFVDERSGLCVTAVNDQTLRQRVATAAAATEFLPANCNCILFSCQRADVFTEKPHSATHMPPRNSHKYFAFFHTVVEPTVRRNGRILSPHSCCCCCGCWSLSQSARIMSIQMYARTTNQNQTTNNDRLAQHVFVDCMYLFAFACIAMPSTHSLCVHIYILPIIRPSKQDPAVQQSSGDNPPEKVTIRSISLRVPRAICCMGTMWFGTRLEVN